jgi:hypothetical protein
MSKVSVPIGGKMKEVCFRFSRSLVRLHQRSFWALLGARSWGFDGSYRNMRVISRHRKNDLAVDNRHPDARALQ